MSVRSTYRRCRFRWSSFWSWQVCKQAKMSRLGHRKPARLPEKVGDSKRITVCCGFWSKGIIGPFFFKNKQGKAITVNGDCFRPMLNEFLYTNIEEGDIGNIWFQEDGTTCHTLDVLRLAFEDRIISCRAEVVWPPWSCNLTPLDYYFGGYWQHLVSVERRYMPHSRRKYFWRSYYQQSWWYLATSKLRFNTVGLLFVG